jgi:hypothetical protein
MLVFAVITAGTSEKLLPRSLVNRVKSEAPVLHSLSRLSPVAGAHKM